jgi:hypothetical protein
VCPLVNAKTQEEIEPLDGVAAWLREIATRVWRGERSGTHRRLWDHVRGVQTRVAEPGGMSMDCSIAAVVTGVFLTVSVLTMVGLLLWTFFLSPTARLDERARRLRAEETIRELEWIARHERN